MAGDTYTHVGFTGTQAGMNHDQGRRVAKVLQELRDQGATHFHWGMCIGADDQAAMMASNMGYRLVGYPGDNPLKRGMVVPHVWHDYGDDNLKRNTRICGASDILIAAPRQISEIRRSGTWMTARHMRRIRGRRVFVVYPDNTFNSDWR